MFDYTFEGHVLKENGWQTLSRSYCQERRSIAEARRYQTRLKSRGSGFESPTDREIMFFFLIQFNLVTLYSSHKGQFCYAGS